MDFIAVLEFLMPLFEKEKIDFAFIGGFALQKAGVERATRDIDFMILTRDAAKLKPAFMSRGYEVVADNENVLCFVGKSQALGRIDFLLAHRPHALKILARAKTEDGLLGKYRYKVALPEDIIGLKVQAIANSAHRREKDLPDIKAILRVRKGTLDMELVRDYFDLFGMGAELDRILKEVEHAPHP
jgi:hypothetical protein